MPFPRALPSRLGHVAISLAIALALVLFAAWPSAVAGKTVEGANAGVTTDDNGGSGGSGAGGTGGSASPPIVAPTPSIGPITGTASAAPSPTATPAPDTPGYDVSYPQCGKQLPEASAFQIVGVNRGKVFTVNKCLAAGDHGSQLEWAGRDAQFYMNTGNPGPDLSSHWPDGQTSPRPCNTRDQPGTDTDACAYDYGWNAAAHAYSVAVKAYISLGWAPKDATRTPVANAWWLDVETSNTWRDWDRNIAVLHGAVDYLESVGAESVGFYSTELQWFWITGYAQEFADYPSWHAGAVTRDEALADCANTAFTGGRLTLTQYFEGDLDANVRCPAS
ncbi:MAG TPA: hypothetical protein VFM74_08680 [Candidatus Limnocylindria bacterium]|nr:hypothetical protein [Candidatus Limnocylindria bacterium]